MTLRVRPFVELVLSALKSYESDRFPGTIFVGQGEYEEIASEVRCAEEHPGSFTEGRWDTDARRA